MALSQPIKEQLEQLGLLQPQEAVPANAPKVGAATYSEKPLAIFENVRVKIPKLTGCRLVTDHLYTRTDGKMIPIEEHYEHKSCSLGERGYVQRNLYGLSDSDDSKLRVADVIIWEKCTGSGRKVLLLDIRKIPEELGIKADLVLKFTEKSPWHVAIPFGGGIRFVPITPKPRLEIVPE